MEPITLLSVEQDGVRYELQVVNVQPADLEQAATLQLPVAVVARKVEP